MVEDNVLIVIASDTPIAVLHLLHIEVRVDSRQSLHWEMSIEML
jgi:hypothetical protein